MSLAKLLTSATLLIGGIATLQHYLPKSEPFYEKYRNEPTATQEPVSNTSSLPNEARKPKPSRRTLQDLVNDYVGKHQPITLEKVVVVEKRTHWLHVYINGDLIKSYRHALGKTYNDKIKEGDGATPEGIFFVQPKPNSQFNTTRRDENGSIPFIISYPTPEDAARGLEAGIINKWRYNEINRAHKQCKIPPQRNDGLGSNILIHGGGSENPHWTLGCIALYDSEVNELHDFIEFGCDESGNPKTPVIIVQNEYTPTRPLEALDIMRLSSPLFNPSANPYDYLTQFP